MLTDLTPVQLATIAVLLAVAAILLAAAALLTLKKYRRRSYRAIDLKSWWVAYCEGCRWQGLSSECGGGQPTCAGDYDDVLCPICGNCVDEANSSTYTIEHPDKDES